MRFKTTLAIISSLAFAAVCAASDHEADRALEGTLRAEINQSGDLARDQRHIHIHVHRGVVSVNGRVQTAEQRQRIESLIRNSSGVVAVKDELRVTIPSTEGDTQRTLTVIPVHASPPPVVERSTVVVTTPAPVIIPNYPNLKVQAGSEEDEPVADRIVDQLQDDALPADWMRNVTITVRDGNASLRGSVETREQREAIIASLQRAGGLKAIYDELRFR